MGAVGFTIPGRIRGKGRPRFVRATGRTYTDDKTQASEAVVRQLAALAMRGKDLLEGPLHLSVVVRVNAPQSWSKKRRGAAQFVTGRPDCDNLIKLASDAMNGIVYRDDSQIAQIQFDRRYSDGPEAVGILVSEAR